MNAHNFEVLRAGLNYILEGRCISPEGTKIAAKAIRVYGKDDVSTIKQALALWESQGKLRVLKDFSECAPGEYAVEMLAFIGEKSPIKNWLNWQ